MSSSTRELYEASVKEATPTRLGTRDPGGKGLWASAAVVLAALGASLCCIGPLLFVTFGVGAGLASTFEPIRPLFTGLLVVALGIGFYTVYGRRPGRGATNIACAPGDTCARPRSRMREKVMLWTATVLALVLWSFNYWSTLLV